MQGYVDLFIGQIGKHGTGKDRLEIVQWFNYCTFNLRVLMTFISAISVIGDSAVSGNEVGRLSGIQRFFFFFGRGFDGEESISRSPPPITGSRTWH